MREHEDPQDKEQNPCQHVQGAGVRSRIPFKAEAIAERTAAAAGGRKGAIFYLEQLNTHGYADVRMNAMWIKELVLTRHACTATCTMTKMYLCRCMVCLHDQ